MKTQTRFLSACALVLLAAACAENESDISALSETAPAPTAEEFAKMAKFSRRPDIKREKGTSGYHFNLGEAVWLYRYTSQAGNGRHSYILGLYKGGTLFGRDRAGVEESTRTRIQRMKNLSKEALEELAEQSPEEREEMQRFLSLDRVETRGDGREVYFCFMGHRGEAMDMTAAGFSTIGSHDLLLWHRWERSRYDSQFEKEPEPACELPEIFKKIERHLAAHEGAEAAPETDGEKGAGKETASLARPPAPSPVVATIKQPYVNSLGMRFVPVPIKSGKSEGTSKDEVVLLFSVWETRISDFAAFADEVGGLHDRWRNVVIKKVGQEPSHPVVNVGLDDMNGFCQWLTKNERQAGRIGPDDIYRLPSDHEWSCAVGIGGQEDAGLVPEEKSRHEVSGVYPWGEQWPPPPGAGNLGTIKGYEDEFSFTAPVGSFSPNKLGLQDLAGNVMELTSDYWDGGWSPLQGTKYLSLRGSSYTTSDRLYSLSSHRGTQSTFGTYYVGFRCVLERSAAKETAPK